MTMNKTQRRILGAMLALAGDDMHIKSTVTELAKHAGYKATGGVITYAIEFLEYHNKIVEVGDNEWLITI